MSPNTNPDNCRGSDEEVTFHSTQFQRGQAQGVIMARLSGHDQDITALKTGQVQISVDLTALKLSTQELAGAAIAAAETVKETARAATEARLSTAAALKEAKDRDAETLRVAAAQSTATWSPFARTLTVIAALTAVVTVILEFVMK